MNARALVVERFGTFRDERHTWPEPPPPDGGPDTPAAIAVRRAALAAGLRNAARRDGTSRRYTR